MIQEIAHGDVNDFIQGGAPLLKKVALYTQLLVFLRTINHSEIGLMFTN